MSRHHFAIGDTVHTVEGVAGKIIEQLPHGGDDPMYAVDWEDGVSDQQPESLFEEALDIVDDEDED